MSRQEMTTRRFESFKQLSHYAQTTERALPHTASEKTEYDHEWDYGMDLQTTLHNLDNGYIWDDGVNLLKTSLEVTEKLAAKAFMPGIRRDVVGGAVSIGAFLAGHPRNMRRREPAPAIDKPVLSVGIPINLVCTCRASQRANYGAAILSVCNQLERKGYRLNIDAIWRAGAHNPYSNWINVEINVKGPRQRLNMAAFSFAIMHAAVFRRAGFRVAETVSEWGNTVACGYGYPANDRPFHNSMASDYDLYFDNMDPRLSRTCNTPEGAFGYVLKRLEDQLERALQA
jgi:hypothetical protein